MPMFSPKTEYTIERKNFPIKDFFDYKEEYVVRPPYQRKSVWSNKKQQALLDSLFRRYYVPRIVVREVRLNDEKVVFEIIDGQQRIITVQRFIADELPLPKTLKDLNPILVGARYSELPSDVRRFVDRDLEYVADLIKGIDDPGAPEHQKVATEIFWRLQQGESLNFMEVAHSRLSSLVRNFVVKYGDDQRFDYEAYVPIDENPDKHPFFKIIARNNDRMQHLALLTRLLILEENKGAADIRDVHIMDRVDDGQQKDGIGNYSFDNTKVAKALLQNMKAFYEVFKDDPMLDQNGGMKEFRVEYFIISIYLLLRHLRTYYVFGASEQKIFYDFVIYFHQRWQDRQRDNNADLLAFADNRQQSETDIETRDRIIRQVFFEWLMIEKEYELLTKDERRAFNEAERIEIYRRDKGFCQMCLKVDKPEKEARVSWSEYQADHVIPHSKGGTTDIENAQLLCRYHNAQKGAKTE